MTRKENGFNQSMITLIQMFPVAAVCGNTMIMKPVGYGQASMQIKIELYLSSRNKIPVRA
jgi:acyl-CoA reductase-like NAD-dependent aldehyde dehydrogenase